MDEREWEQHQEFERAGALAAELAQAEAEAQAGNHHFQSRYGYVSLLERATPDEDDAPDTEP